MANERWVPIYSRLFDPDHELAGDDPVCQRWAWADICFMAQYKDGTRIFSGRVVTLRRGEFLASLRFLEKRWRWSKNRVARFLKALEKVDKIQPVETHRSGTVFAVVRYDEYCPSRDSDEPTREPTREPRDGDASGTDVGQITEGTERATSTDGADWPAVPAATTKKGRKKPKVVLPESWTPTDEHRKRASDSGINLDREVAKFRNHATATDRRQAEWNSAFTNWLIGAEERTPRGNGVLSLLPEERIPDGEGGYRITRR